MLFGYQAADDVTTPAGLVPVVGVGLDLAPNEAAETLPERLVLGFIERAQANGVERVGGHDSASLGCCDRWSATRASSGEAMVRPASRAMATSALTRSPFDAARDPSGR